MEMVLERESQRVLEREKGARTGQGFLSLRLNLIPSRIIPPAPFSLRLILLFGSWFFSVTVCDSPQRIYGIRWSFFFSVVIYADFTILSISVYYFGLLPLTRDFINSSFDAINTISIQIGFPQSDEYYQNLTVI